MNDHLSAEAARARAAEAFRDVIRGQHLTYEQMEAHVDGREDAGEHLAVCAMCVAEVEDLRGAAEESHAAPWWTWAAAAALAMAILGSLAAVRQPRPPRVITVAPAPVTATAPAVERPAPPPLPTDLREVLRQLADGVLPSARIIAELQPAGERTRGGRTEDAPLRVLSPAGVVEETQPRFRWTTRPGATYVAEVFDERYRPVARSEPVRGASWRPARPLARGATYSWQVTETRGDVTVTAPEPPQPPARFHIIGSDAAAELQAAPSPLARALIYAREGMVDRAAEELRHVTDPSPEVRRALETLRRYQPAPTTTNPPQ